MPRFAHRGSIAIWLALAVLVGACGDDEATDGSGSAAEPWPHLWVADVIGGGQLDAGELEGRDLVLWFWAPD